MTLVHLQTLRSSLLNQLNGSQNMSLAASTNLLFILLLQSMSRKQFGETLGSVLPL
jgi:hypothetical protein